MRTAVIVIPTYNEAGNIGELIHEIHSLTTHLPDWRVRVLVVDSTSPDGTADVVRKAQHTYSCVELLETAKEGLGKAYQRGFSYAIEHMQADILMEMDADFSHPPADIPHFLSEIDRGADFVIGSRYKKGGSIPVDWGWHRKLFSVLGNWIIRLGFMKLKITDWTSGFRAIRAAVAKECTNDIQLYSNYVFQVAFLDNVVKKGYTVAEVPLKFVDRTKGSSKINAVQYIRDVLWYVLTHSSFLKFALVGATGFVIDTSISKFVIYLAGTAKSFFLNAIGPEIAVVSNYLMNNYWSFAHKKAERKLHLLTGFFKFNLAALGSIIIQSAVVTSLVHMFGEAHFILYKVFTVLFIILPYSYIIYNKFIWKTKK